MNIQIKRIAHLVRADKTQEGYVYLIKSDAGLYKIGRSKNITRRIFEIPKESRETNLRLVHSFFSEGFAQAELDLHQHYSEKRVRKEWFQLSDQDVQDICSIKAGEL